LNRRKKAEQKKLEYRKVIALHNPPGQDILPIEEFPTD